MKKIRVNQDVWEAVSDEGRKKVIDHLRSQDLLDPDTVVIPDSQTPAPSYRGEPVAGQESPEKGSHEDCIDKCLEAALLTLALCEAHGGHPDHCDIAADKLYTECAKHC